MRMSTNPSKKEKREEKKESHQQATKITRTQPCMQSKPSPTQPSLPPFLPPTHPPIHVEYFRSGGADILILTSRGACLRISFNRRSP